MKLIALGLIVAAVAPLSTVERITSAAYRDYIAQLTDKFAATTVKPANGEAFRLLIPLGNGDDNTVRSGSGYYSYAGGVLTLALSSEQTDDRLPLFLSRPRVISASTYRGQNAYGAAANVRSERILWQGVALVDGPEGATVSQYAGMTYVGPHDYWHKMTLSGPEAKAVALDTDMVVEGRLVALPDGKVAGCKSTISDPTLNHPREVFAVRCYAGADVSRVAFVRRSTGAVLKEWRR